MVINSIIFNENSARGALHIDQASQEPNGAGTGFASDYVVDGCSADDGEEARLGLGARRARTGQDAHSVVATIEATFVDARRRNYVSASRRPAVDRAAPAYAPPRNIVGQRHPLGGAFDIGALSIARADR